MVQLTSINPMWIRLIKILSPILMIGAIMVDGAIAYRWSQGLEIPKLYVALGAIGSVALAAHLLEGIVAGIMAQKKGMNPFRYGIYTFLVGTVAFIDLMDTAQNNSLKY